MKSWYAMWGEKKGNAYILYNLAGGVFTVYQQQS